MLGGRRLKPQHNPISEDEPTADDLRWSDKLWNYMQEASPQESIAEQQKRSNVMAEITTLFKAWVTSVCESKGVPHELAIKAGGQVLTWGCPEKGRLGRMRKQDADTQDKEEVKALLPQSLTPTALDLGGRVPTAVGAGAF